MIINGNTIAAEITDHLEAISSSLKIVLVGTDSASELFVQKKIELAEELGVNCELKRFSENTKAEEIITQITTWQNQNHKVGVIVQLPLPEGLNRADIIKAIKPQNDVDGLLYCLESEISKFIPPVVLGIERALQEADVDFMNQSVLVIGQGFLVGRPIVNFLKSRYPDLEIVITDENDAEFLGKIKLANVLIGAASALDIITADMIKEGAILIDAGSKRVDGHLRGNFQKSCYEKASYYTPVPGGIGPMTVAYLFQNLSKI